VKIRQGTWAPPLTGPHHLGTIFRIQDSLHGRHSKVKERGNLRGKEKGKLEVQSGIVGGWKEMPASMSLFSSLFLSTR